ITSLPLFHRAMASRIRNLDHRRAANLLAEPVGRCVPLLAGALGDVDLAPEALLGASGGVVDLVAVRAADHEHVDVVRRRSGLTLMAGCP
ncbi:hypothetical protein ADS78_12905, partial [Idiomarina abyssalis]